MDKFSVNKTAQARNIPVEKVEGVVEICRQYGIELTGNVFNRTPEDVEKIILICREHGLDVDLMKTCFRRVSKDVESIIEICEKNQIPIEPILFRLKPRELLKAIEYVSTFGHRYLKPALLAKDLEKLKQSMPYMEKLGLLKYAVKTPSVLELSEEELRERTAIIMYLGERPHKVHRCSKEDKLSSIYSYTKERYKMLLEDNSISEKIVKYQTELLLEKENCLEK